MANLLVKLNRIKDEEAKKKYFIQFKSKESDGVKTVLLKRENWSGWFENRKDKNFRYEHRDYYYEDPYGVFYDVEKLEERFRGITKAEVISKESTRWGTMILVLDYTTENFFINHKKAGIAEAYSDIKRRRGEEVLNLTKTLMKTLKQKGIVFDERSFIKEINYNCSDEHDVRALRQCNYILQNNIRATKGRYCYGASEIWNMFGFKVIHLHGVKGVNGDNSANYAFLTERR